MTNKELYLTVLLDSKLQEEIVQKFIRKELTSNDFIKALQDTKKEVRKLVNKSIQDKLKL